MDQHEREAREAICRIGHMIWQKDMVAANDGNLSVRLSDGTVLCTPTGVSKGMLTPESICHVAPDGTVLHEQPPYRVSSEVKVHLELYRASADVNAVAHAHPLFGTLAAIKGEPIEGRMIPENVVFMPHIPVAPYATPSTQALADVIRPYVDQVQACLMEQHGALTWGHDLTGAYLSMERLEFTCKLRYFMDQAGIDRELPEDEVRTLSRMRAAYGLPAPTPTLAPAHPRASS